MQEMQDTQFDPWVRKISSEKKMATHSSILAWRILWTEEPSRLQSMGSDKIEGLSTCANINLLVMKAKNITI